MRRHARRRDGADAARRCDPTRILSLMLLRVGLVGCQRPPHYPTRDSPDAGFVSTRIAIGTDDCPALAVIASPVQARIGDTISVTARAGDANGGTGGLIFARTASAGGFARADASDATYTCPGRGHAGPQTISLSVSDGLCATTQSVAVFCDALADGGGPATTQGAGESASDAGVGCATPNSATTCHRVASRRRTLHDWWRDQSRDPPVDYCSRLSDPPTSACLL